MKEALKRIATCFKNLVFSLGIIFILMSIVAFTRIPYDVHHWLGDKYSHYRFYPNSIVMLGGSGMPSESNLIRLYYVVELSKFYKYSDIVLAHPVDSAVAKSMRRYLINAGVDSSRISMMLKGTNTREQAMELKKFRPGFENTGVAIVTSPENMYRTMRVFKKLDYTKIGGNSSYENAMFVSLKYSHKKLGGRKFTPDVSENMGLRYNFWNYLKLEITCMREFVALTYYKLNGWI